MYSNVNERGAIEYSQSSLWKKIGSNALRLYNMLLSNGLGVRLDQTLKHVNKKIYDWYSLEKIVNYNGKTFKVCTQKMPFITSSFFSYLYVPNNRKKLHPNWDLDRCSKKGLHLHDIALLHRNLHHLQHHLHKLTWHIRTVFVSLESDRFVWEWLADFYANFKPINGTGMFWIQPYHWSIISVLWMRSL